MKLSRVLLPFVVALAACIVPTTPPRVAHAGAVAAPRFDLCVDISGLTTATTIESAIAAASLPSGYTVYRFVQIDKILLNGSNDVLVCLGACDTTTTSACPGGESTWSTTVTEVDSLSVGGENTSAEGESPPTGQWWRGGHLFEMGNGTKTFRLSVYTDGNP